MFYDRIASLLDGSAFIRNFDRQITAAGKSSLFYKLNMSAISLLLARAFKQTGKNIVLVSQDDKLAEDFSEDLSLLIGNSNVQILPDYEVLPYEDRSPHYSIRAQRIETLFRAVSNESSIFCVSIRSLLRQITHPAIFRKNIIKLKQQEDYNPELLVSNLVGMGYDSEFQVSRVGEIARRGGIIDVFSPSSSVPVRIEFWGDTIESIRVFSINTQRSTGETLSEIDLIPSREFSLHDVETTDSLWELIHNKGFYEGIELDVSLLIERIGTFCDFFSTSNTIFFFDEFQFFPALIYEMIDESTNLYQKRISQKPAKSIPEPDKLFVNGEHLNRIIRKFPSFFVSKSYQEFSQIDDFYEMPVFSQENLNGNLNALESDLNNKIAENYSIFIQSDNRSQSERMRELLPTFEDSLSFSIGVFHKGFGFNDIKLAVFTDHEIFSRYKRKKTHSRFSQNEALADYEALKPGDYIVHIDHGIGIFSGLRTIKVGGSVIECLMLRYAGNDVVYVPTYKLDLVSKFVSEEGIAPTIHKLGSSRWENSKRRARRQIELVARDLIKLYAERRVKKGIVFDKDTSWQRELESSFIYEDTPDQVKAVKDIKSDMESTSPMERLLCGDVGFGKTEVAIRAAFKSILSGFQVGVLVPTTLLAEQHFLVFKERLAQYPVKIAMFSRFRSQVNLKKDVERLKEGDIDIVIGTHRLLSKDIRFKKLGLLIIDEEHRFGVRHKDKLRKLKSNVDTLYMSATPIPRTMYMALSKLKELSLIRTSPKARLPIRTVVTPFDNDVIKDAVSREAARGGQVFFVHNRVQTINSIAAELRKMMPKIKFRVGHGQLPEKQLERIMLDFAHHKFDVLIATTIIESGIDIPNANTMIVNRADMFGLAQLYQIRGRVGRSNRRAYAYLLIPAKLTEEARKRLETLTEYESLGSGYQIAMKDMEIRGVGTLLGTKQSGIINTIGFNYYNRLLERAIKGLQEGEFKAEDRDDFPQISIDKDFFLPENYIKSDRERLNIYRSMLNFSSEKEFLKLEGDLKDRFGELPSEVIIALMFYKIRVCAQKAGLNSFSFKNKAAVLEFEKTKSISKQKISAFMEKFRNKISFRVTDTFQINVEFTEEDHIELLRKCYKMIRFFDLSS